MLHIIAFSHSKMVKGSGNVPLPDGKPNGLSYLALKNKANSLLCTYKKNITCTLAEYSMVNDLKGKP